MSKVKDFLKLIYYKALYTDVHKINVFKYEVSIICKSGEIINKIMQYYTIWDNVDFIQYEILKGKYGIQLSSDRVMSLSAIRTITAKVVDTKDMYIQPLNSADKFASVYTLDDINKLNKKYYPSLKYIHVTEVL